MLIGRGLNRHVGKSIKMNWKRSYEAEWRLMKLSKLWVVIPIAFIMLFLGSTANARITTIAWTNDPFWPSGTTIELEANGASATGITGTQYTLDIPVQSGEIINVRVRAVPPAGYQCGDPIGPCPPSDWTTLVQTWPSVPSGLWARWARLGGSVMAAGFGSYSAISDIDADNTVTAPVPSGLTSGDLWLVFIQTDTAYNASNTITVPSGWTAVTAGAHGGGNQYPFARAFYKAAGASESAQAFTLSMPGGIYNAYGASIRLTGVNTTSPIDVQSTSTPSDGSSIAPPSVTVAENDSIAIALLAQGSSFGSPAFAAPSGYTLIGSQAGNWCNSAYAYKTVNAGSLTPGNWTIPVSSGGGYGNPYYYSQTIIFKPVGGASGDANTSLTGVSGTGSLGSPVLTGAALHALSGNTSTGTPGSIAVTGAAIQALIGNSGIGSLGTLSLTGTALQAISGLAATGSPGTPSLSGAAAHGITGTAATGSPGTVALAGGGSVTVTGTAGTGAIGLLTFSTNATYTLPGIFATAAAGNVNASADGNVIINLPGVGASGGIGSLTIIGAANKTLSGIAATTGIGSLTIGGGAGVALSGVSLTGTAGTQSLAADALLALLGLSSAANAGIITLEAGASVTLSGISATGDVGTLIISAGNDASIALSGTAAIVGTGNIVATGNGLVLLQGVSATGHAGSLRLAEILTPAGRLLLIQADERVLIVPADERFLIVNGETSIN